jgi:hypothetical protein
MSALDAAGAPTGTGAPNESYELVGSVGILIFSYINIYALNNIPILYKKVDN